LTTDGVEGRQEVWDFVHKGNESVIWEMDYNLRSTYRSLYNKKKIDTSDVRENANLKELPLDILEQVIDFHMRRQ
jgi:hypothetical protein